MNKPKILLITEGKIKEYNFFSMIASLFSLNIDIVNVNSNIYLLYNKMKEYDFNIDVKDAIKEILHDETDENKNELLTILNNKFAYVYLIYDFDIHHNDYNNELDYYKIVEYNIDKLSILTKYFINETDPTVGKLYLNYPMMESMFDLDSCDDISYFDKKIHIEVIPQYKKIVSKKRLSNKRFDSYSKFEILSILKLNILKLFLINGYNFINKNLKNYHNIYDKINSPNYIFDTIINSYYIDNYINILNSSIMFLSDYNYDKFII